MAFCLSLAHRCRHGPPGTPITATRAVVPESCDLAPGSWRIAISSVNAFGEGPPSISAAVVIQDR